MELTKAQKTLIDHVNYVIAMNDRLGSACVFRLNSKGGVGIQANRNGFKTAECLISSGVMENVTTPEDFTMYIKPVQASKEQ